MTHIPPATNFPDLPDINDQELVLPVPCDDSDNHHFKNVNGIVVGNRLNQIMAYLTSIDTKKRPPKEPSKDLKIFKNVPDRAALPDMGTDEYCQLFASEQPLLRTIARTHYVYDVWLQFAR